MGSVYSITPGYEGCSKKTTPKDIQEICQYIKLSDLRKKCIEYGVPEDVVDEYVKHYENIPSDDLSCIFTERGVEQMATGGGEERIMKERVRKAFCLLVADECFKRDLRVYLV